MSVVLTQTSAAAFPDRPADGAGKGLQATLSPGLAGQYLRHELPAAPAVFHCRFLLNPATAANGQAVIHAAFDDAGAEVHRVAYDTDTRTLSCLTPDGNQLSAVLDTRGWHCVEVGVDPANPSLELWLNGLSVGVLAAPVNAVGTAWIGTPQKDEAATGELWLDEWMVGDAYLGPATTEPASPYADDPARWLVLFNTADPEAVTWATAYRAARGTPFANLLGLDLPLAESIAVAEYEQLQADISNYLDRNGLSDQVMGILCGYRAPGYVIHPTLSQRLPLPALLHTAAPNLVPEINLLALDQPPTRPVPAELDGKRLTARIDGPDLASAVALIDRAAALAPQTLGPAETLYVDPTTGGPGHADWGQNVADWYTSLDRQRLRLTSEVSGDPVAEPDAGFDQLVNDAFYWGWGPPTPPAGFFDDPAGSRVVSLQLRTSGADATTLRSAVPTHWIDTALDAGYAAAVGTSLSYTPDALPFARPFFEALRRGWTLAEAYLLSVRVLRDGLYLVGDPLLQVNLPRAGWDVFGPLARAEDLDPDAPAAALPGGVNQFSLSEADRPSEGGAELFLTRRIDELGRSELGFGARRFGRLAGQPAAAPPKPAWPHHDQWALRIAESIATATLVLPPRSASAALSTIELLDDQDTPPIEVAFTPRDSHAQAAVDLTSTPTRFRWRLTSPDGLATHTPWSIPVRLPDAAELTLTPLEA